MVQAQPLTHAANSPFYLTSSYLYCTPMVSDVLKSLIPQSYGMDYPTLSTLSTVLTPKTTMTTYLDIVKTMTVTVTETPTVTFTCECYYKGVTALQSITATQTINSEGVVAYGALGSFLSYVTYLIALRTGQSAAVSTLLACAIFTGMASSLFFTVIAGVLPPITA